MRCSTFSDFEELVFMLVSGDSGNVKYGNYRYLGLQDMRFFGHKRTEVW